MNQQRSISMPPGCSGPLVEIIHSYTDTALVSLSITEDRERVADEAILNVKITVHGPITFTAIDSAALVAADEPNTVSLLGFGLAAVCTSAPSAQSRKRRAKKRTAFRLEPSPFESRNRVGERAVAKSGGGSGAQVTCRPSSQNQKLSF